MFSVVEFTDGLSLVPKKWLSKGGKSCFWPNNVSCQIKLNKMVMSECTPEPTWVELEVVKIFDYADTYVTGIEKLKLYQQLSELESDSEKMKVQRRDLKRKRFGSDSEQTDPKSSKKQAKDSDSEQESDKDNSQSLLKYPDPPFKPSKPAETCSLTFSTIDENLAQQQYIRKEQSSLEENGNQSMLELLLKKVNYLIEKVNQMEKKIDKLSSVPSDDCIDEQSSLVNNLPCRTMEDLEELEKLLVDDNIFKNLVKILKRIGGSKATYVVNNVLKRVLLDEVAEEFSWAGAKKKRAFKSLKVAKAVLETTRSFFPSITEDEVSTLIANWLRHAKQRKDRANGLIPRNGEQASLTC